MANAACFVCFFFGVDLPHLVAEQMCVVFGGIYLCTYVPVSDIQARQNPPGTLANHNQ